jgi:hypothetical protein
MRQRTHNLNIQGGQKAKLAKSDPIKKWANEVNRSFSKE